MSVLRWCLHFKWSRFLPAKKPKDTGKLTGTKTTIGINRSGAMWYVLQYIDLILASKSRYLNNLWLRDSVMSNHKHNKSSEMLCVECQINDDSISMAQCNSIAEVMDIRCTLTEDKYAQFYQYDDRTISCLQTRWNICRLQLEALIHGTMH